MEIRNIDITDIINTQYKAYSFNVIENRAIPSIIDGLKPVHRRILWTMYKYYKNEKVKVVKVAGSALSLHPHSSTSVEDACSLMAQKFSGANNITYLDGFGAFGGKCSGPSNGIGAARYVSVKLSDTFFNIMNTDPALVEMISNYDDSEKEPKNFLPIVPTVILNPVQGIAVGFACNIYPRNLEDVIHCQLQYLNNKDFREPKPYFDGFNGSIEKIGDNVWKTIGCYKKEGKYLTITELPIGYNRETFIKILDDLEQKDIIKSFTDDCKKEFEFNIILNSELNDSEIIEKFKLFTVLNENINVIGFDGKIKNMTVSQIIKQFTDYRFEFYLKRFKLQYLELKEKFEYERDFLIVIQKALFKKFPELSKKEIEKILLDNEIQDKHISKIIQTPIYKFGKDEINILKERLHEMKKKIEELVKLCKEEGLRKDCYITELKGIK
jgi:DNA topoisomerase-2